MAQQARQAGRLRRAVNARRQHARAPNRRHTACGGRWRVEHSKMVNVGWQRARVTGSEARGSKRPVQARTGRLNGYATRHGAGVGEAKARCDPANRCQMKNGGAKKACMAGW